jgi:hypothetical protein
VGAPCFSRGGELDFSPAKKASILKMGFSPGFSIPSAKAHDQSRTLAGALKHSFPRMNAGAPTKQPAARPFTASKTRVIEASDGDVSQAREFHQAVSTPFSRWRWLWARSAARGSWVTITIVLLKSLLKVCIRSRISSAL